MEISLDVHKSKVRSVLWSTSNHLLQKQLNLLAASAAVGKFSDYKENSLCFYVVHHNENFCFIKIERYIKSFSS